MSGQEPRTEAGRLLVRANSLDLMTGDEYPLGYVTLADVLAIEAEARQQGAREERARLRALAPERLAAAWALMPEPYEVVEWSSTGTGPQEPPLDARRTFVHSWESYIGATVAALFDEPARDP